MLLTILFAVLLIIGIALIIYGNNTCYCDREWVGNLGIAPTIIGVAGLFICTIIIMANQIGRTGIYEAMKQEAKVLEYRLKYEKDISDNHNLYESIVEYNNTIIRTRCYKDNVWVSWFYNPLLADLELIDISEAQQ